MGGMVKAIGSGAVDVKTQATLARNLEKDLGESLPRPLRQLAKVGAKGHCARNSFRDFAKRLRNWRNLNLDLMYMDLPVVVKKEVKWVKWPFLPPHHVANSIWRGSRAFFEHLFAAKEGGYVPLWAALGDSEYGAQLPAVRDPYTQPWRIGYRVHGDAFRCFRNSKVFALQWRATQAKGNPWTSRLLFTLLPWHLCVKVHTDNTLRQAVEHMCRMLNILHSGIGPSQVPPPAFLL